MKKILIFALSYYPNPTGGAEPAMKEITDHISPEEIEFHMVTLRWNSELPKEEKVGNVHVHRIGLSTPAPTFQDHGKWPLTLNKAWFQFAAAWKAVQLHRIHKFNGIWSLMAHSAGVPGAIFNLVYPRVPWIVTLQEGDPIEHIERVMKPLWPLFTRAFTRATVIQAISGYLADWARARGATAPIEIIHNGANPKDVHETVAPEEVQQAAARIQKQPGETILMNTARLVHQKGHDTVIRALALLPQSVRYVMVGDGSDEQMLRDLAKELGVEHRVLFTGRVDRSQVTAFRKNADIFVGPSRSEGLGNAFLSAMASRLPVIATQEGGIAEFLFDAKRNPGVPSTGFAVDKESPQQIADAITYILAHPEEVKNITENARAMVLRDYEWGSIAKQMRERVFIHI